MVDIQMSWLELGRLGQDPEKDPSLQRHYVIAVATQN